MEGREPNDCPHFSNDVAQTSEASTRVQSAETESPEIIPLFDGQDLNPDSARVITRANLARVVVVAGEADSGKTTLLASIYEQFNAGGFAGYLFAGSRTLLGWERRCHLARVASGRSRPDTERTLGRHCPLLHLRVRSADLCRPIQDVLFTDVTGEVFRDIRDSTSECRKLAVLRRADHFVLTLDGAKLAQPNQRQEAFRNGAMGLRSFLDAGMLSSYCYVDVLFTKYDILRTEKEEQQTREFLEYVRADFKDKFEARVARLRFFEVAARPAVSQSGAGQLGYAHGIDKCFPSWVEDTPLYSSYRAYSPGKLTLKREFDAYLWKRLPRFFARE